MTCQQLTELITEYLDGSMSMWKRAQFHMHLGMCSHCRAYLHQMKTTVEVLGEMPHEQMPADIQAELLERFASMSPRNKK